MMSDRKDALDRLIEFDEEILAYINAQAGEIERLKGILLDARMQIEYLHDKFRETGTGNAMIARINMVLCKP